MRPHIFIGFALLALTHLAFANITSASPRPGALAAPSEARQIPFGRPRAHGLSSPRTNSFRETNRHTIKRQRVFPRTIRLNEHAILEFSITLERTGGNSYKGTWSHGYATTFTVTSFTKNSLNMMRRDNPALGSVSGTYTGQRSGNSASGEAAISNGFRSTWDATWP